MLRVALLAGLVAGCASVSGPPQGLTVQDLSAEQSGDDLLRPATDDLARRRADDGGAPADDLAVAPADMVTPIDMASGDLATGCSAAQHVVVNEVQTQGPGGASDEFIELYNPCAVAVDINTWSLVYRAAAGTTDVAIIQINKAIAGNGYLLITGGSYSGGATADQTYPSGKLSATGGGIALYDSKQTRIDSVGYGSATNAFIEGAVAAAPSNAQSLARKPNGSDTDHNDVDFALATPTPKAAN